MQVVVPALGILPVALCYVQVPSSRSMGSGPVCLGQRAWVAELCLCLREFVRADGQTWDLGRGEWGINQFLNLCLKWRLIKLS